jgi:hypothetical protein
MSNPLGMNWAESLLQKLIYFLVIATLVVADICVTPIFDMSDMKGKILNYTIQFFVIYIVTIWFSKIFVSVGRRIR